MDRLSFWSIVSNLSSFPLLWRLIPDKVSGLLDDSSVILWEYGGKKLSANSPYEMLEIHIDSITSRDHSIRKDISVSDLLPDKDIQWCPVFKKWWKISSISQKRWVVSSKNWKWDEITRETMCFQFNYCSPEWGMFEFFDVPREKFEKIFRWCFNLSKHLTIDYSKQDTK